MAFIEPMHRNKPNITYLLTAPDSLATDGHVSNTTNLSKPYKYSNKNRKEEN